MTTNAIVHNIALTGFLRIERPINIRLGIVVTLLSRQFQNKDNNCHNKMMETIKTIKIFEIILPEKHN